MQSVLLPCASPKLPPSHGEQASQASQDAQQAWLYLIDSQKQFLGAHVRRRQCHHRRRRRHRRLQLKWGNYKSWINGGSLALCAATPSRLGSQLETSWQSLRELAARCQDIRRRGLCQRVVAAVALAVAAIAMLCQLKNLTSNGATDRQLGGHIRGMSLPGTHTCPE